MLKDFISAMRGGICAVMGNRYINGQSQNQNQSQNHNQTPSQRRSIWYIDAINLYIMP